MPNWPYLSPVEQQQKLADITQAVVATLPEGWRRLVVRVSMIGQHNEASTGVQMPDESVRGWSFPPEVWRMFMQLRKGMYDKGLGTWVSFEYILNPPFRYSIRYNRDEQPAFDQQPTGEHYATENRWFPREEIHIPAWYQRGLHGTA
jgi:hypothetical protein